MKTQKIIRNHKIFYCDDTKSFDKIYTVHPALSSPFCVFVQDQSSHATSLFRKKYFLCLFLKVFEEFMFMLNYIPSILRAESFISVHKFSKLQSHVVTQCYKIAFGDYIFIFQKSMYVATRANTAHKSNHARKNTSLIATRAFDLWSLRTLLF